MSTTHLNPAVKHDLVLLFDATNSNPNGDPDFGNQPRTDPDTGHGLVTDVSVKRKIRDTLPAVVERLGLTPDDFNIFVQAGDTLNAKIEKTAIDAGVDLPEPKKVDGKTVKATPMPKADQEILHEALNKKYVDIRLFGAVLGTGKTRDLTHVRGPLQVSFGRSIDPIAPVEHTITRVVATADADKITEMGTKWTVPYGLYRIHLHYSGNFGAKTGVTAQDLDALYLAIQNMLEHTRSAARSDMNVRGLYVFSHSDAFGDAPAHQLQDLISVTKTGEGPARAFTDYTVAVDDTHVPEGVTLTRLVG